MTNILITILTWLLFTSLGFAAPSYLADSPKFEKIVLSKNIFPKCDIEKGDERGPFSVTYKENKTNHLFLVLTGVYYDTCKELEQKINHLKRNHSKLILLGTEDNPSTEPNEIIWRWRSVRTIRGNQCVSYFRNDCE